ncbi:MAG: hypothetical protein U0Q15_06650 [Kineosporiaceae bacterium]
MSVPSVSVEQTIDTMLAAAGLTVSAEERAAFIADYPAHRASLDALYAVPMVKEEEPQLVFSPLV